MIKLLPIYGAILWVSHIGVKNEEDYIETSNRVLSKGINGTLL